MKTKRAAWWQAVVLSTLALAACEPSGSASEPCQPTCTVPAQGEPRYVPQCQDVEGRGPCVGEVAGSGMWIYVSLRAQWPHGRALVLCPTEDGGPEACVWVPSVQGNNSGDSGALVYGVK